MPHQTGAPNYDDAAIFPGFASKLALLQALSDPKNTEGRNRLEFLAQLANTDLNALSDKSTVGLSNFAITGRLG